MFCLVPLLKFLCFLENVLRSMVFTYDSVHTDFVETLFFQSFSANFSSSVNGALSASCCSFKASRSAILSASFFLGLVLVVFISSLVESLLLSSSFLCQGVQSQKSYCDTFPIF